MVNWNDPYTVYLSARAYILTIHLCFGMLLWEILTTLRYDWELLKSPKKLRFGSMLYLLGRYGNLITFVLGVRTTNALDATVDCQTLLYVEFALSYFSGIMVSGLIMMRVYVLSSLNMYVFYGLGAFWLACAGLHIYSVYHTVGSYTAILFACTASDLQYHRTNQIVQFAFEATCMAMMMWYLLRMTRGGSLWTFMVQQGAVYIGIATFSHLTGIVALHAHWNEAAAIIPNVIAEFLIVVCCTRMHRNLAAFSQKPVSVFSGGSAPPASQTALDINTPSRIRRVQVQTEVTTHQDNSTWQYDYKESQDWESTSRTGGVGAYPVPVQPQPGRR